MRLPSKHAVLSILIMGSVLLTVTACSQTAPPEAIIPRRR